MYQEIRIGFHGIAKNSLSGVLDREFASGLRVT